MGLFSLFSRSSASESSARTWTLAGHAKLSDARHRLYTGLPSDMGHDVSVGTGSYSACDEQSREGHPDTLRHDRPQAQHEQTPFLKDILPHIGTNDTKIAPLDSPADSPHLVKGSGRFVTLLRSRKSRRQNSRLSAPKLHDDCVAGGSNCCDHKCTVSDDTAGHRSAGGRRLFQGQKNLMGSYEARNASDRTTYSRKSDLTSVTVSHHPSKHTLAPIVLFHRESVCQNPFDELGEPCRRVSSCYPFLEPSVTTISSATQASSYCGDMNPEIAQMAGMLAKSGNPFDQESFRDHENLSLVSSSRTASRDSTWSLHIDRHTAIVAFNKLAAQLHLDPLELDEYYPDKGLDPVSQVNNPIARDSKCPRRRDRVLGRIRVMRSTLHMKAQPVVTHSRTLRRMRTFANFSSRSCDLSALKGRSLESLARLGGHSFLSLPVEFAPATLRLPTCFVATISYLKCFALSTPEVFCTAGDLKMAARVYDYFAKQVLSAENVRDRIEATVRRGELPIDLIGIFDHSASREFSSQVLSVGWVFKALLAGLPGGILGSARLYRILVSICYGRIAESNERNGDYGGVLSPLGHTKLQAIGLAVLALTTPMQLNLICAFFGLCAMLRYETERAGEDYEFGGDAGRSGLTFGLSSVERLGHVLGPLLTPDGGDGGQNTFRAIEREIENQRVMTMLISSWGSINQQLRVWQNQGSVARRGSFFRLFSWEQPLADGECHGG
ncbi:hypothetical protein ABOM_011319 [Aspergillus bombycis]|uniref:Rho-GAP domain-containing protein n=1 Tax=Aspergillus bombycis TaxID=109264 RepID=A0A1F7ZKE0_9EURO|nr:hypothetical protein ABOM_011319 [Aspergillus bombycis]OGM39910.1 hypothetical protein ABOM_011319 [Aspergillus bombycis]